MLIDNIPIYLKTSPKEAKLLRPFLRVWEEHDIVTCYIHEIPVRVYVGVLFTVPKDKTEVCPIIDFSELIT